MMPGNSGQLQTVQMQTSSGAATTPNQSAVSSEPTEEEPLYVNAKQYNRILKRRAARAKLEAEGRIPRERKVSCQSVLHFNKTKSSFLSVNFFMNLVIDMQ
jgi:hypothetical protein